MITIVPVMRRDPEAVSIAAQALDRALPGYTPEDIIERHASGQWSIWHGVVHDAETPTDFFFALEHTREGLLVVALAGHSRDLWLDYVEKWMQDYCICNSIPRIVMWGRPGWTKEAERRGWNMERIMFSMEVN